MKTKAREVVLAEAKEVILAAHGKNEFYSLAETRERLNAVMNMAEALNLLTAEEMTAIKREAKEEV